MANFYDENQWYPGTIVAYSETGYMVVFEGFEADGAQDTEPRDVELLKLPDEDDGGEGAIDLETYQDMAAEIASVMENEVSSSDIRAALEATSFKVEVATTRLLDWVAAGKPNGAFANTVNKKAQTNAAPAASASPLPAGNKAKNTPGAQDTASKKSSPSMSSPYRFAYLAAGPHLNPCAINQPGCSRVQLANSLCPYTAH